MCWRPFVRPQWAVCHTTHLLGLLILGKSDIIVTLYEWLPFWRDGKTRGKEALYRVAVCEDQRHIREELCALCRQSLGELNIPYDITSFSSADRLGEAIKEKIDVFDLLILDIQMEGKSGLELATELRQADDRVSIIFVTGCEEYLRDGYSVQPIQFLLKPVNYPAMYDAIRTAWKLSSGKRHVLLQEGARTVLLTTREVRLIESFNHGIMIHQGAEPSFYRVTLTEAERSIQSTGCFCRCHNSFLVNMDWVSEITRTKVILSDGEQIPIGRRYYESAQKTFIRYMAQ